jgi:hypothetical protein
VDAVSWLEWWTAERVIALAAVGQLVVLVAAALFARAQVREARELRAEQARPFVVVDFELDRRPLINLVVANLGKTMARNTRITVDPPLRSTVYDSFGSPIGKLKLFTEVVPSLAPGKRIVLLFDSVPQRTEAGLPDSYQVRLSYEWDGGRPIVDTQRLDLDLYRHQRLVWQDTIHDVSKTLKQIERRMTGWSSNLGGLLVRTPDEVQEGHEAIPAGLAEQSVAYGQAGGNGRARLAGRLLEVIGVLPRRR